MPDRLTVPVLPTALIGSLAGRGASRGDHLACAKHHAPSTPGDLFFHIRSDEFDVAFELARRINAIVEDHIDYHDEVHAFQYQDFRDPLGFVDGTESPRGQEGVEVAIIRDGIWEGGSYIVEQKYVHNLKAWNDITVEEQEQVIGRTKHSDIELDEKAPNSHVAVNQVEDEDGNGLEIVRNNLSFGDALGKQGTFFMSYARDPRITEVMLRRMFVGEPEGNHDRILPRRRPTGQVVRPHLLALMLPPAVLLPCPTSR